MRKLAFVLPTMFACALLAIGRPVVAITITDDTGAKVVLTTVPRRIVSLTPATTEMLFAVGVGAHVVGDTTSDDYPPAAQKIAKIGDWVPNYEKIVALKPDLVVVDDIAEPAAVARLRGLHQTVLVIHPATIERVEADIRLLGCATSQTDEANQVVATMERKIAMARALASTKGQPNRPRVLPIIGHDPLYVAGRGTFIADALRTAGAINIADHVNGYAPYSYEAVLSHPPDIILANDQDIAAINRVPALRTLSAVRHHRFVTIDPDLTQRPGPRLADGVLAVAQALARK